MSPPLFGGFLCYLAVFSFFGFQHGFLDILNGDLAAVAREVIANHDLIFVDIHRIDEGIDQALRISDVRPVTFCNIREVVEDLFFIGLFLYQLPPGDGKFDFLQFVLSIFDHRRNGGGRANHKGSAAEDAGHDNRATRGN